MISRLLRGRHNWSGSFCKARTVSTNGKKGKEFDINEYHEASDSALEELSEKLEDILEEKFDKGADISLSSGVLTITVDSDNTYVINKQTPNRQIWLSSPISGPMRFEFVQGRWLEKNSKTELRQLLSEEMSKILQKKVDC